MADVKQCLVDIWVKHASNHLPLPEKLWINCQSVKMLLGNQKCAALLLAYTLSNQKLDTGNCKQRCPPPQVVVSICLLLLIDAACACDMGSSSLCSSSGGPTSAAKRSFRKRVL